MITYYQRTIKDDAVRTLDAFKVGSWIHVEDPAGDELTTLAEERGLDVNLLKDAIDPNEVPRVEREDGVTYIYTRFPLRDGGQTSTSPVLIAMASDYVMTLSRVPLPFLESLISGRVTLFTTQKAKLLTQIFSQITFSYNRQLTDIGRRVRGLRVRLEQIDNDDIKQLVIFESELNDFLAALVPTHALLAQILSGKYFPLYEKDQEIVEDVMLASAQLVEMCKTNLSSTVNIRDAYSTIMTNNLNRVIKMLTALTVIIAMPTMVASFYGMNVSVPLSENQHIFFWIVTLSLVVSGGILVWFSKNRWL